MFRNIEIDQNHMESTSQHNWLLGPRKLAQQSPRNAQDEASGRILQSEGRFGTENVQRNHCQKKRGEVESWEELSWVELSVCVPSFPFLGSEFATWGSKKEAGDWTQATSKCSALQKGWGGPLFRQLLFRASLASRKKMWEVCFFIRVLKANVHINKPQHK